MSSFWSGAGGGLIGGGLGLVGAGIAGMGSGREARRARDFQREQQRTQYDLGQLQRLLATAQIQGGGEASRLLGLMSQQERDYLFDPQYGMSEQGLRDYLAGTPGVEGQMQGLADRFERRGQRQLGDFDAQSGQLRQNAQSTLGGLQSMYGRNQAGLMSRLGNDNSRISQLGLGLEGMAQEWGRGREAIIDQDAQRNLTDLNQRSAARLSATGLGSSTLTANAMRGNASEIARGTQRAKQDLAESQIDRQMGARQYRTGLEEGRSRLGLDILGSTNRDAQNLAATFQGRQLDQDYARAGQRTGLQSDLENRALGLQTAPIQSRLGFLQGPVYNPVGGFNSGQFSNYYSGGGGAQSALGQSLAGMGGLALGNWLGGLNQQQGNYATPQNQNSRLGLQWWQQGP